MKKENNSWVSENGNEIKEDTLMKLYDVHYKDQQVHIDSFQKHLEIFLTVIAGLITVFIGGMLQFHEKPFAFTLVGIPLFIVFFSEIGKKTIDRFYQRFLESIVIIAKIENILGLDDSISDKNLRGKKQRKPLWIEDKVFLLDRWVEDRFKYNSSAKFISEKRQTGIFKQAIWIFRVFEFIGIVLFFASLFVLVHVHDC